jgi:hypothetical protein
MSAFSASGITYIVAPRSGSVGYLHEPDNLAVFVSAEVPDEDLGGTVIGALDRSEDRSASPPVHVDFLKLEPCLRNEYAPVFQLLLGDEPVSRPTGPGEREVTNRGPGSNETRRLDIADVAGQRAVEHKTGHIARTWDVRPEVERDAAPVRAGWDITWHFEGTASAPLLAELRAAGIRVTGPNIR